MNSIEFEDYIFDRYAYLEMDPSASHEDLRRAIARRRAENHPDKLLRVSEAVRAAASSELELIDECARMLLNQELRALYDEKLAAFRAEAPSLISVTGARLIDLSRFKVDLDYLVNEEERDIEALWAHGLALSGYDEKRAAKARARLAKLPDDLELRDELREELSRKLSLLHAIEDVAWSKAGAEGAQDIARLTDQTTEQLAEGQESQIAAVRVKTTEAVEARQNLARLGFAPSLLLEGPGRVGSALGNETSAQLARRAVASFDQRVQRLRSIMGQIKETTQELTTVARRKMAMEKPDSKFIDVLLIRSDADFNEQWPGADFTQEGLLLRFPRDGRAATHESGEQDPSLFEQWPNTLILLERNEAIKSVLIEAIAAVNEAKRRGA